MINKKGKTMETNLKIEVAFQDEEPDEARAALEVAGVENIQEIKQSGLTGIEIVIVGILVTNALANLVAHLWRLWKCGIIVDTRGSTVLTQKNCDLPQGTVLMISPDGVETTLDEPTDIELKTLIDALIPGGK